MFNTVADTPHVSGRASRSPAADHPRRISTPLPPRRRVEHTRDRDGTDIVRVELPCGTFAKTDPESFAALQAAGVSLNWTRNANGQRSRFYVRVGTPRADGRPRNLSTVARLILAAPPGTVVHYRDGGHLNLRSDNLKIMGNAPKTEAGT